MDDALELAARNGQERDRYRQVIEEAHRSISVGRITEAEEYLRAARSGS